MFCSKITPVRIAQLFKMALVVFAGANFGTGGPYSPGVYAQKPDEWFSSDEGRKIIATFFPGRTPKAPGEESDTRQRHLPAIKKNSAARSTMGTTPEIRFLSRAYRLTKDERCLEP